MDLDRISLKTCSAFSAYCFILDLACSSWDLTTESFCWSRTVTVCGSFVRMDRLNRSSDGGYPVVEFRRNVYSSFFQSFCSVRAARIVFVNGFMKFSASEFAWGYRGVIRWWFIPNSDMYDSNSLLVKGGPLSLRMMTGTPCVAKIRSNLEIVPLADVE